MVGRSVRTDTRREGSRPLIDNAQPPPPYEHVVVNPPPPAPTIPAKMSWCRCLLSSLLAIICLTVGGFTSVAAIVIGAIFLDPTSCPRHPLIAPLLIASGGIALLILVIELSFLQYRFVHHLSCWPTCLKWTRIMLAIPYFFVILALSVFVFRIFPIDFELEKSRVVDDPTKPNPHPEGFCQPLLIIFSFATAVGVYGSLATALFAYITYSIYCACKN